MAEAKPLRVAVPLNTPRPIEVRADDDGRPLEVRRDGWQAPRPVTVLDRWRIDDEWWRSRPISRLYHTLLTEDGVLLTAYRDLIEDRWYEQRDG
jgi:hypothetical protein